MGGTGQQLGRILLDYDSPTLRQLGGEHSNHQPLIRETATFRLGGPFGLILQGYVNIIDLKLRLHRQTIVGSAKRGFITLCPDFVTPPLNPAQMGILEVLVGVFEEVLRGRIVKESNQASGIVDDQSHKGPCIPRYSVQPEQPAEKPAERRIDADCATPGFAVETPTQVLRHCLMIILAVASQVLHRPLRQIRH